MHQFLEFIYFGLTIYTFRTVFPSIIRSSRLYIQQHTYVTDFIIAYCCICFVQLETELQFHLVPASKQTAEPV
jgi:hypothetical protein